MHRAKAFQSRSNANPPANDLDDETLEEPLHENDRSRVGLAIIPARYGSKRVPRKNLCLMEGRPSITWTIQAIQDSGLFEKIVVSTDSLEIAEIAMGAGAAVPFLRPSHLSGDQVPVRQVIQHVLNELNPSSSTASFVCCVYFVQVPDTFRFAQQEQVA